MPSDSQQRIALFIDFENLVTRTGVEAATFDLQPTLDRLLEKGKVVYRRAYADWHRFPEARRHLHDKGVELVEVPPSTRTGKNGADIRLVIDALELAYLREHMTTFAIASGDSDFTPLVYKLRENDRYVIGLAVRGSASPLFVKACDEFIYVTPPAPKKKATSTTARVEAPKPEAARAVEKKPAETKTVAAKADVKADTKSDAKADATSEDKPAAKKPTRARTSTTAAKKTSTARAAAKQAAKGADETAGDGKVTGKVAEATSTAKSEKPAAAKATRATRQRKTAAAKTEESPKEEAAAKPPEPPAAPAQPAQRQRVTPKIPDVAINVASSMLSRATGRLNPSAIKEAIVRIQPDFDVRDHGFSTFSKLLEAMEKQKLLKREQTDSGQWYVSRPE